MQGILNHNKLILSCLLVNNCYLIAKEIISALTASNGGVFIFVFWAFGATLFIFLAIVEYLISKSASKITWLLQVFVLLLYYTGCNIYDIARDDIRCTANCQDIFWIIAFTALLVGIFIHDKFPKMPENETSKPGSEDINQWWSRVSNLTSRFISIDVYCSLVVLVASLVPFSHPNRYIFPVIATIIVIGWVSIFLKLKFSHYNLPIKKTNGCDFTLLSIVVILMIASLLQIISNLNEPINNQLFYSMKQNSTSVGTYFSSKDSAMPGIIVRIISLILTPALLLLVSLLLFCKWRNDKHYPEYHKIEEPNEEP